MNELFASDTAEAQKCSAETEQKKRIEELRKSIRRYQKSYYNGEGEISDEAFDALWDELKSLNPSDPLLKKIGQDSGNFEKVRHIMPMGSQEKVANPEQFLGWAQKHDYGEYLVEYKLDGASLELQYEKGNLVCAVTRGDGTIGDDKTTFVFCAHGIATLSLFYGWRLRSFASSVQPVKTDVRHARDLPDTG